MSKTDVMSRGQGYEFLNCLERAGFTSAMAQLVINSPNNQIANELHAWLEKRLGAEMISWGEAIDAFGDRALSISIAKGLRIEVPSASFYATVPLSRADKEKVSRRGLFIVAMPPISLINLQLASYSSFYEPNRVLYQDDRFTRTVARAGYHLMFPTYPVSDYKTFAEQLSFCSPDMDPPYAVEVAYTAIAWLLVSNQVLLTDWVRCADMGRRQGDNVALKQTAEGKIIFSFSLSSSRTEAKMACGRYLHQ